ncbi:RNA polymerase sigma factor [Demequina sp. NBRC 110055]|uniref:RNA polymerase sigma factor n=1 Tax=Demequina sp. NBRC 110055 TaxID=1570344 RepID=UPI0009FDF796|nr:RNA polymerase sigma factor [Demequina sp. NBRC 110055]
MDDVEAILHENGEALLAYLERRIGVDDAPDALAETMAIVWRRRNALPADETGARMWLFGIARGVVRNAQRGHVRRTRLASRLRLVTQGAVALAADDGLPVRDAIARLEPSDAELLRLVHWDGFTLAEVAALEQVPPSTIRSRYARAKAAVALMLAPAQR